MPEGCNTTFLYENDDTGTHPELDNKDRIYGIIDRSEDLQRRIAALYYHDYMCLDYQFPPAAGQGASADWLEDAMKALLEDRPLDGVDAPMWDRSVNTPPPTRPPTGPPLEPPSFPPFIPPSTPPSLPPSTPPSPPPSPPPPPPPPPVDEQQTGLWRETHRRGPTRA